MQYKTHILGAITLVSGLVIMYPVSLGFTDELIGVLALILGSLFPDIDYHKSKLGKYFFYLNYGVTHRGFLHSLFGVVFLGLVCWVLYISLGIPLHALVLFLVGVISHLLLDAFTKKGIRPLYPFSFRIRGPFRTGKIEEFVLLFVLSAILVVLALW